MRVCAPGLIPRKPSDRIKTDTRDAENLARELAAGGLSFVRVPSEQEQALRDLVRAREDVRQDLSRAPHRLSKFLPRRDPRWDGGSNWTRKHLHWIGQPDFDDTASQLTCAEYLNAVRVLVHRRDLLERALEEALPATPFAQTAYRLRCFRGIDTLSAMGLCAEIGDWTRFAKPGQLSAFLGIVPAEYTTDSKRRGSIIKAGSSRARRLLVEAAWHYRRTPRIGETLERRQRGIDPRVIDVAWRCQQRLYERHRTLRLTRNKPAGVVNIACARELAYTPARQPHVCAGAAAHR